jgi:hypothetical protein
VSGAAESRSVLGFLSSSHSLALLLAERALLNALPFVTRRGVLSVSVGAERFLLVVPSSPAVREPFIPSM